ncbi:Lipoprotein CseA precursor [Streptomyces sp. S4.7]|uniref:hypothetical protein n=1 Tax=Streptomyces sp. S4.7 TaxID=2705439 RepID=UPI001398779B|nr:hypothetical protein [Streptomyces sp. S4.7]QHY97347.1 Lipoprotein CseA precursor [Streptomyces sp. S4.7]
MRGLKRGRDSTSAPGTTGRRTPAARTTSDGKAADGTPPDRTATGRTPVDGAKADRAPADGISPGDTTASRFLKRLTLTATTATGALALVVIVAFGVFAIGSTSGTGTRDEGAAAVATAEPAPPPTDTASAMPAEDIDPVALIRRDPKVSGQVKADLKPCSEDAYPVDTSYGNLTGGTAPDVVVNVMSCDDAVGLGTYVYRESDQQRYENVFVAEEPAVYATIDRGELVVTRQVYAKGDPVSYPSGEDIVTYSWADTRFTERYRVRNNYSGAVGNGPVDAPAPSASIVN